MNIGWNIETLASVGSLVVSVPVIILIVRINWKRYGFLYVLSAVTGVLLCYIFMYLDMYTYPYRLFPSLSQMSMTMLLTIFPLLVLVGVRYSPQPWAWKIPFYWVVVHIGMLAEVWAEESTRLIQYNPPWDAWDSYTWWWIYLLVFEWVGGLIVSPDLRQPIDHEFLRHGRLGWFIVHFILISTVFLAGVYTQMMLQK